MTTGNISVRLSAVDCERRHRRRPRRATGRGRAKVDQVEQPNDLPSPRYAETVRAALEKLGSDGQGAQKKIEAAACGIPNAWRNRIGGRRRRRMGSGITRQAGDRSDRADYRSVGGSWFTCAGGYLAI